MEEKEKKEEERPTQKKKMEGSQLKGCESGTSLGDKYTRTRRSRCSTTD